MSGSTGGGVSYDAVARQLAAENFLRQMVDNGWSISKMVDGFADQFSDEMGMNTGACSGHVYSAGKYSVNSALVNVASASTDASNAPSGTPISRLYDEDMSTGFAVDGINHYLNGIYLQQSFAADKEIVEMFLDQTTSYGNQYVSAFDVAYSDNGTDWTQFTPNVTGGTDKTISWSSVGAHKHWRLIPTGNTSPAEANWYMAEWRVFEANNPALVLQGVAQDATESPSTARLVLLHSVALDGVVKISRDNGVTFASASTVEAQGSAWFPNEGELNISTCDIPFTGVAGTQIVWRFEGTAGVSNEIYGVWVQWQ
ncbi:discoidin domain-containing protein [Terasakiella sp. SH-1]|uniref:discoidin domain-containing protein n=1 Tax=Terasakiella sp. SH-1 TaxID=2560057 RepID=UPI0010737797|nr:discoidin domain-containing protein [Terasakiella sp. SH-1]